MEEKNNIFGKELRSLRTRPDKYLTQQYLASLVGVTASYISQLETGNRKPSPDVIRKLSNHLGVKTNHLFGKLGMAEMDLAGTFINNKDELKRNMPGMSEEQLEELANFLTYMDFKSSVLD